MKPHPLVIGGCLAVGLIALPPLAHGAPRGPVAGWVQAEQLRQSRRFKACGQAYEALAKAHPRLPQAARFCFNAAACYDAARRPADALRVRKALVTRYPRAKHVPRAMVQIAAELRDQRKFRQAAVWFERFANRYPRNKTAADAAQFAMSQWARLGDEKRLLASVTAFTKRYRRGRRHSRALARAHWLVVQFYRARPKRRAEHLKWLKRYLREHGTRGPAHLRLQALVSLAEVAWQDGCSGVHRDGLCVARRKGRTIRYRRRKRAAVRRARKLLRRVLALWRRSPQRFAAASRWRRGWTAQLSATQVARAQFLLAELDRQSFLTKRPPPRRRRWTQRLRRWWGMQQKALSRLKKSYAQVYLAKGPHKRARLRADPKWSIAALARTAELHASLGRKVRERLPDGRRLAAGLQRKAKALVRTCRAIVKRLRLPTARAKRCSPPPRSDQ